MSFPLRRRPVVVSAPCLMGLMGRAPAAEPARAVSSAPSPGGEIEVTVRKPGTGHGSH